MLDLAIIVLIDSLWHQDRKLSIILKFLLELEAGFRLGILIYVTLFQNLAVAVLVEGMSICMSERIPSPTLGIVSWLVPMIYGLILLGLSLYKATEYWQLSSGFKIKYFWVNHTSQLRASWTDEIRKPDPRSSVSIIYFAVRAFTAQYESHDTRDLDEHWFSCLFSFWIGGFTNLVNIVLIDYILLIRVLALWQQNRKLSIILNILLGLDAGFGLGILIYGVLFEDLSVGSLGVGVTICIAHRASPRTLSIVSWLVPMTYGLVLLSLALYKAAEYWKMSSGFKGFHLVRVLIQDQVIYYGFVIFCSVCKIVNISTVEISPFASDVVRAVGSPALLCILGGQLLINLKQAGERGANGGTNYTPRTVSDIDFGENGPNDEQSSGQEGSA
ncbi:hypothetical protein A7U60_g7990 [Sanghuangporus baumii]|uniref:Uncharacterized protein n=1 Tax=Sanghuangporus baumii TaxID=108892 RepID=A0A9Q5HS82_SANBA|nr:hypothetical protein A7U60_g7990 [Sanghuangporus baumii]